jgi:hypothetical protein
VKEINQMQAMAQLEQVTSLHHEKFLVRLGWETSREEIMVATLRLEDDINLEIKISSM